MAIPSIDGGELSGFWSTMAVALLSGIGITVAAVVLVVSDRAHRRRAPH